VSDPRARATAIRAGDRVALAQAITLVESTRAEDRPAALALLDALAGDGLTGHRVGISGPPGAGKSTFIDALGMMLCEAGHHVAVLAIDPSSARTGGSILGDKTRMARLSREPRAFIRPSPASGVLGGVAARTRASLRLCEAAGFDIVLVETVGVGQSEIDAADIVDTLVVLVQIGAGDELQGIKRGLLECADVVAVTKADGDQLAAAHRTRAEYAQALAFVPPRHAGWQVPVLECSAALGTGIDALWQSVLSHRHALEQHGTWLSQRAEQQLRWTTQALHEAVRAAVDADPAVAKRLRELSPRIAAGDISPERAAHELLAAFRGLAQPS
jgi:LAO/AO transport system kinase